MIPRFYCPELAGQLAPGRSVALPEGPAHHAAKVLRMCSGDEMVVFDGDGGEYPARIVEMGRTLRVTLGDWCPRECEAPLQLTLAQALASGDKMDWIVQKAVELGVTAIQPLQAKRSVVRLGGERAEKRIAHLQQVAAAACEQSGRNRVPRILPLRDLADYLGQMTDERGMSDRRLLLSPHQGVRLAELPGKAGSVTLLVGPEGGFEDSEESLARTAGFQAVTLGPRVLRTETAGLAAIAAVMTLWGDF